MKKFFSLLFIFMFLISNIHASEIEEDPSQDCDDYAAIDYEITGSAESAENTWYQCMEDEINELEEDMSTLP